ncbi:MAG TPA: phosphoribosylaminoimidazolesuccinocarboxamide synthase [Alphaproteobacteria bacterium]|nr:phosphoribosylaminoimidazolesuccinocarboxamide synthase [Rhodospirillaceae bacterium]HRJ12363.1 phosphoribosylaminoimidazolesuccinocarboxamide synthase [Alphaproteobacteria bacterium]
MSLFSQKRKKYYEGKTKILYEGPEPGTLVQSFKDDTTTENGAKHEVISGKGVLNNTISSFLMSKMNEIGIPCHFIKKLNMREQLIAHVEMIPVMVVVRNAAAGTLAQRYGLERGQILPRAIVEYFLKKDELKNPMVSEEHMTAFGIASLPEIDEIYSLAMRINDYLSGMFLGVGLRLVDFKLEFGRQFLSDHELRIVVADEISPDVCRIWDVKTNESLDKDRFRTGEGDLMAGYRDIAARLGVFPDTASGTDTGGDILSMTDAAERASKLAKDKEAGGR